MAGHSLENSTDIGIGQSATVTLFYLGTRQGSYSRTRVISGGIQGKAMGKVTV
jgi:hypothetical protein